MYTYVRMYSMYFVQEVVLVVVCELGVMYSMSTNGV